MVDFPYGDIKYIYGYESIPINTIFRGLFSSINPSYFDVNRRGTIGFDTLPYNGHLMEMMLRYIYIYIQYIIIYVYISTARDFRRELCFNSTFQVKKMTHCILEWRLFDVEHPQRSVQQSDMPSNKLLLWVWYRHISMRFSGMLWVNPRKWIDNKRGIDKNP